MNRLVGLFFYRQFILTNKMEQETRLSRLMEAVVAQGVSNEYFKKKMEKLTKMKGGNNIMETKSRYEVIAELEQKKRDCLIGKDSLDNRLKGKERELKELKRNIEDKEEEIKDFKDSMEQERETFDALIKSVDQSLERFAKLNEKK